MKGCEKYSLQKESVIAPFVEWFKTPRGSSSWVLLVLTEIYLKDPVIVLFLEQLKTYFERI